MRNWRTTIVGVLGAVYVAVQPIIQTGGVDWPALGVAAFMAAIGYFAKDAGVSGTAK
jgi:hypothetical protein